jgi:hypothetical protein
MPLPSGTVLEVCVDEDGFCGSWLESTALDFEPVHGHRIPVRFTIEFVCFLTDTACVLAEPFAELSSNLATDSTSTSAASRALLSKLQATHTGPTRSTTCPRLALTCWAVTAPPGSTSLTPSGPSARPPSTSPSMHPPSAMMTGSPTSSTT